MPKFEFCLPTLGKAVPAGKEWFHEINMTAIALA
jgi:bifunctional non-homologous end joining protein LigD